jgi:hypothetical protein
MLPSTSVSYAQYSLAKQVLQFPSSHIGATCIIFTYAWPHWALLAYARKIFPSLIVLKQSSWSSLVLQLFPHCTIYPWDLPLLSQITWPRVDLTFSDFNFASSTFLPVWSYTSKFIISQCSIRHFPPDWSPKHFTMSHSSCGGVTDGSWHLHVLFKTVPEVISFTTAFQSISVLLSPPGEFGVPCSPPSEALPPTPEVIPLGPRLYHSAGLIPWMDRSCSIVCSSVFSATGWRSCPLSSAEWSQVIDIPTIVSMMITPEELHRIIQDLTLIPLKCLPMLYDSLLVSITLPQVRTPISVIPSVQPVLGTLPHGDPSPVSIDFQKVAQNQCNFKAVNADDAEISVYIWDAHVQLPDGEPKNAFFSFFRTML